MNQTDITRHDRAVAQRLLGFLPIARRAEASEGRFAQGASYRERASGVYHYRGVRYPEELSRFWDVLAEAGWLDMDYDREEGFRHVERPDLIAEASFPAVRRLLTFCDRGECFVDGFWGTSFEDGFVRRLLERLEELAGESLGRQDPAEQSGQNER